MTGAKRALAVVFLAVVLGLQPAERIRADSAAPTMLDAEMFKLDWGGTPLPVFRYRGSRDELCRPIPCITPHVQVAPISPSLWVNLDPKALLHPSGTQVLGLVLIGGATVENSLFDVKDVYVGPGISILNRYVILGLTIDLWRLASEPNGPPKLSTGLLTGGGKGPGGFRWKENLGVYLAFNIPKATSKITDDKDDEDKAKPDIPAPIVAPAPAPDGGVVDGGSADAR